MLRAALATLVLSVPIALAGCGGDDDGPTAATTSTGGTVTATAPPASTAATTPGVPATTATAPATTTATGATGATSTGANGASAEARAYGAGYERRCATFRALGEEYGRTFSGPRPKDRDAAVRLYRTKTAELLAGLRTMYRGLAAQEAPAEYAAFQRKVVDLLPEIEGRVDRAERIVEDIEDADSAGDAGRGIQRALSSITVVPFPTTFRALAPSCLRFR